MPVLPILFGPWLPDQPAIDLNGLTVAENVVPGHGCYHPMASAIPYSPSTLPSRPSGAAGALDSRSNSLLFAGCTTGLFKFVPATNSWSDVSRPGGYNTGDGERWRFAEFGSLQIATNFGDPLQAFDKNTGLAFGNLTPDVRARFIMTLDNFVVVGSLYDEQEGELPTRIRWSGLADPGWWEPSVSTMSDFQDIQGYGRITGLVGGDDGIIFLQRAIFRMTFVGEPAVFTIKPVIEGKGCAVPASIVTAEGRTYFLDDDGFYQFAGGQLTQIGEGKVNQWFRTHADPTHLDRMTVEADPANKVIYWLFADVTAQDGNPNRFLCHNYATGNWSEGRSDPACLVFRMLSLPTSIAQLGQMFASIEDMPASWDSPLWAGGRALLAGLDPSGRLVTLEGPPRPARVTTGEIAIAEPIRAAMGQGASPASRAMTRRTRPIVTGGEGAAFSTMVGHRDQLSATQIETPQAPMGPAGETFHRVDSRYQQMTLRASGEWEKLVGVEWDAVPTGGR